MAKGRKPIPTKLHVLRGNPSKKNLDTGEPRYPAGDIATPPAWLSGGAQAEWLRIAPALIAQGVLTTADRAAFIAYCESFAQVELATARLNAEGFTVEDRRSSWITIRRQGLDQLRHWGAVFGLDPSSRSKIVAPGIEVDDELTAWQRRRYTPRG